VSLPARRVNLGLFLLALASLAVEVLLTRVFDWTARAAFSPIVSIRER